MHIATYTGNEAICTLLVKRGAEVNAKNNVRAAARQPAPPPSSCAAGQQCAPSAGAAHTRCSAAAALTRPRRRRFTRFAGRAQEGLSPLHYAAKNGRESICVLLCEHGADVNAKDDVRAAARKPAQPPRLRDQADARPRAAPAPPPQAGNTPMDVATDDATRAALRTPAKAAGCRCSVM